MTGALKSLQNKKGQKIWGTQEKSSLFFIKGLLFSRVPQIFWALLILKRLQVHYCTAVPRGGICQFFVWWITTVAGVNQSNRKSPSSIVHQNFQAWCTPNLPRARYITDLQCTQVKSPTLQSRRYLYRRQLRVQRRVLASLWPLWPIMVAFERRTSR